MYDWQMLKTHKKSRKDRKQTMKGKCKSILFILLLCILILNGCKFTALSAGGETEPLINMPNPATVYCKEQGGTSEILTGENGMYGVCHFNDGSTCDEWAFFRGECAPGTESDATNEERKDDETQPVIGMPNPATVYCKEQGGSIEMRTDENGMYGVCHFSDGSTCDEWAFFRGECKPGLNFSESFPIYGWYGTVISPPADQPFAYYLTLYPKEAGNAGLIPMNDEIEAQLSYLRDSGRLAHFWGVLNCAVADFSGCQVEVTRVRPDGPGEFFAPDPVDGWQGTLSSTPFDEAGSHPDDFFMLTASQVTPWATLFPIRYGIDAADPAVAATLDALLDTGAIFSVYGELTCGIPDTSGCQIRVEGIEGGRGFIPAPTPVAVVADVVADWYGVIKSTPTGAQFDDYFEKSGHNNGSYGISSKDAVIAQQLAELRDSNTQVRLWGLLLTDVPDYGGYQIEVTRIEVLIQPEPPQVVEEVVENWVGVIVSFEPGAQFDDYFERQDSGQINYYGIDSMAPDVQAQIVALRDSDKVVHLYGTLLSNVPDCNGLQIQVNRIWVEEQASDGYIPPGTAEEIADWWGVIKSTEPGAQFDDYFERQDLGQIIDFGIDSLDPAVQAQIKALRGSGRIVHLYGTLFSNVPDYNGSQIQVDRIEVEE